MFKDILDKLQEIRDKNTTSYKRLKIKVQQALQLYFLNKYVVMFESIDHLGNKLSLGRVVSIVIEKSGYIMFILQLSNGWSTSINVGWVDLRDGVDLHTIDNYNNKTWSTNWVAYDTAMKGIKETDYTLLAVFDDRSGAELFAELEKETWRGYLC